MKNFIYRLLTNNFVLGVFLITSLTVIGITGYKYYFGFNTVDAIYMTVITISTVGYGEVMPLTQEGKIFTSLLIVMSILVYAFSVTSITAYIINLYSTYPFKLKKMQSQISKLHNHIIIAGFGRNGRQATLKLLEYNKHIVLIELEPNKIDEIEQLSLKYVEGDATHEEILMAAGIEKASYLITCLPSDADNVFITLTAKQINPNITIISRATADGSYKKLKIAGATNVIMPDKLGGDHMASLIVSPNLLEFIDNISSSVNHETNIKEVLLTSIKDGARIGDLRIKEKTGCTIIGYKTKEKDYIINPDDNQIIDSQGSIIVIGQQTQIANLIKKFDSL